MIKKLPLLFLAILFVSCASTRFESNFSPVYVTNFSKYALLPPSAMSGKVDSLQRMSAKFGNGEKAQELEFDVYVISDQEQLSMTIFNEFGVTMGSLLYDGATLDFESSVFPANFKPEYIVADLQFFLYDASELKSALNKIGIDFEISIACGDDGITTETRTLSSKGKPVSKIVKKLSPSENTDSQNAGLIQIQEIQYENFLRGYSYSLAAE